MRDCNFYASMPIYEDFKVKNPIYSSGFYTLMGETGLSMYFFLFFFFSINLKFWQEKVHV